MCSQYYLDAVRAELPAEEDVEEEDVTHDVDEVEEFDDEHLEVHAIHFDTEFLTKLSHIAYRIIIFLEFDLL